MNQQQIRKDIQRIDEMTKVLEAQKSNSNPSFLTHLAEQRVFLTEQLEKLTIEALATHIREEIIGQ